MSKFLALCLVMSAFLFLCNVSGATVPVYQAVPTTGVQSGYIEVFDQNAGVEYGKARIEYKAWQSGIYWYYAYQIFNNDYFNTPTNPDDDYHLGLLHPIGSTTSDPTDPTAFQTINKFSLNLDPNATGVGPDSLFLLDALSGSTAAGGGPWGHGEPDPGNIGVDWTVSLGSNTPKPIGPARSQYTRSKGVWSWSLLYQGDASRNDVGGGQYFEIASTWAPALRTAAIGVGVDKEAAGQVLAPGVQPVSIPEPGPLFAMLAASGLAGLGMLRRKLVIRK